MGMRIECELNGADVSYRLHYQPRQATSLMQGRAESSEYVLTLNVVLCTTGKNH